MSKGSIEYCVVRVRPIGEVFLNDIYGDRCLPNLLEAEKYAINLATQFPGDTYRVVKITIENLPPVWRAETTTVVKRIEE